jgi:hypothetical protein
MLFIDSHTVNITHYLYLRQQAHIYLLIHFIKMKKKKEQHMSITHIKTNKKIEVLLRLLANNENLVDASSKSGLNIEKTRVILSNKK